MNPQRECCDNIGDHMNRGSNTRQPLSEMKEGEGCNHFEPKLLNTVTIGPDTLKNERKLKSGTDNFYGAWPNTKEQALNP